MNKKTPNSLIHESSPYLLQHAHNPVNWIPFGDEAFNRAKKEDKPLLISIGYSACHWCHVMEHESFEDEQVAEIMNANFINVKVDREERSDVDMIYMQAVQLMTGQGGWPLNCFVMPDGKPFYGGTYFRKEQWLTILQNLAQVYQSDRQKVVDYAGQLTDGIIQSEQIITATKSNQLLNKNALKESVARWKTRMDNVEGGPNRAPKFPLPSNYQFLLRYALLEKDIELEKHVHLTLTKMALGGIQDQLHGGFARYSVDVLWKVPHFEKMLYDNSQLASLYTEAFLLTKNELYKETALNTLGFVENEWYNREGFFYSAFDADSDGEEGKYYVWNELDLKDLLGENFNLFSRYFEINNKGYWEHGNYILMRSANWMELGVEYGLSAKELENKISDCKKILIQESKSRIKPALDDKTITSWNAMMCSAFAKAFTAFGELKYKNIAVSSIQFILQHLCSSDDRLFRTYKNGKAKIDGFLDDYAFTIDALIQVYLISGDETYLSKAKSMTEFVMENFKNQNGVYFYYTSSTSSVIVTRTTEMGDNVMPSSNSQMALNLFYLSLYFNIPEWRKLSEKMLDGVTEELKNYGSAYSNWACLALHLTYPFKEIAIVGKDVNEKFTKLVQHGLTNTIFALQDKASDLSLLKDRYVEGKTMIYVCENQTCQLPVETVNEALNQLA